MINFVREALFKQDSIYKTIKISHWGGSVIAQNADMYNDEFSVEDILCDGEDLTFGEACARKVTFATTVTEDLIGSDIGITERLDVYTDDFSYGKLTVADERYIESKGKNKVKEVTAYDPVYTIYNTDVTDWYNNLWVSASTYTQKQFRDSFFNNFGVSQCSIILDNDNMTVRRTVSGKVNGATVLKSILATNGCMGRCDDSGDFEYFYLPTIAQDLSNAYEIAENGYYMSESLSKFTTQAIDKLIIRDEDNEEIITIGSGNNAYVMANNMLLYGKTAIELQTIAQNIYNRISGVTYVPFEIEVKGNPCLQVGDPIYFTTVDGELVKSYILRRNYTGIQSQKDTYFADGLEKRAEVTVSVNAELIKLRNKTNRLDRDLEHTASVLEDEVLDPDNPLSLKSEIDQTAEDVSLEVTRATGAEGDLSARITTNANNITTKVSKNNIISEINQSAESVTINAGKINLNGAVTANNNVTFGTDGKITAKSGYIGNGSSGFTIGNTAIYNGMTSRDDTSHNGIWLGVNGIALGKGNFKVTNGGVLTAKSGTVGGWDMGTNKLRLLNSSDVEQAYLTGTASDDPRVPSDIEIGSEDVKISATQTSGYAPVAGRISLNASGGTVGGAGVIYLNASGSQGHITMTASGSISLRSGANDIGLSNGRIKTASQDFEIFASSEANYGIKLGVTDSAWAFSPVVNGYLRLGSPNHRWTTVYAQNGTINTSDRNEKKEITEINPKIIDFVLKLKPVSYKFKVGKRTHFGLVAQDVEETMTELGMTDMDFGGLCKDKKENSDEYTYGLRYEEFIAPLIKTVQMQQEEIDGLKSEIKEIKELLKGDLK